MSRLRKALSRLVLSVALVVVLYALCGATSGAAWYLVLFSLACASGLVGYSVVLAVACAVTKEDAGENNG